MFTNARLAVSARGSWSRLFGTQPGWKNGSAFKRSYVISNKCSLINRLFKSRKFTVSSVPPVRCVTTHTVSENQADEISSGIIEGGKKLEICWPSGFKSRFHSVWLRFQCHCPECRSPFTGQKSYDILSIPNPITIKQAIVKDGVVELVWTESEHSSCVPLDYLREHCYMKETLERKEAAILPVTYPESKLEEVDFADIFEERGLMRFDDCVEGGESLFLDVFHVAETFRKEHPEEFNILTRIPASFHKIHYNRDMPVHLTFQRPHIVLNHRKHIVGVFWAPFSDGPLSVCEEDVEPYFEAYRLFAKCILTSDMTKNIKLRPGDTVVFNNRRMVHGRTEYKLNGGERHFEGTYVNIDEFKSKFDHMSRTKGDGSKSKRVGNQDWY